MNDSTEFKEVFILAPGARSTEMLRTLARFGRNTMGLRIVGGLELARTALMRSGIPVSEEFLPSGNEAAVIYSFLNDVPYFASASYADAESLSGALRTVRGLIKQDEREELQQALAKGEFPEKNAALFDVYESYIEACRRDGRIDGIGIIRKAIKKAGPVKAGFFTLKEYPLSFLEEELLARVSGGAHKEISVTDLFERDRLPVSGLSYMKGYGAVNEAEDVIADIFKNDIPLDKAMVVCANTSKYVQTFYDLSGRYGIPVTFGSGVPVTNSFPAALLKLIYEWDTTGYNGIDALRGILLSESFDGKKLAEILGQEGSLKHKDIEKLAETAGNLRVSFDAAENSKRFSALKNAPDAVPGNLPWAEILAGEFEKGIASFIETFAVIRPEPYGRIDRSALNVILQSLEEFYKYAPGGKLSEIVPQLLSRSVSSEPCREGALHICSIKDAMSSLRENVYVCGLSSSDFPGSPAENYLLLDTDLEAFGGDERIPTSANRINRKKAELDSLLSLAVSLGAKVRLSYSDYDLSELKDKNPSSVLFTYFEKEYAGGDTPDLVKSVRTAGYFDSALSASRLAAKDYGSGETLSCGPASAELPGAESALEKAWSPSALDIFFQCPLRFYLTRILRLPEYEPDDPFEVISAADTGTIAHSLMEQIANRDVPKKDFLEMSAAAFDRFLLRRPPIHVPAAELEKERFVKMMGTAWEQEKQCAGEVLSAEEEYTFTHPSGVKLKGYPDRVEKTRNGEFIIADFKTKRRREHVKDDIDTCLQVVIYAWLCEQAGTDISRCEYRYIRKNEVITCRYDEYMKGLLGEKLKAFRTAVENNDFPRAESKEACRYCRMGDICGQFGGGTEAEQQETI